MSFDKADVGRQVPFSKSGFAAFSAGIPAPVFPSLANDEGGSVVTVLSAYYKSYDAWLRVVSEFVSRVALSELGAGGVQGHVFGGEQEGVLKSDISVSSSASSGKAAKRARQRARKRERRKAGKEARLLERQSFKPMSECGSDLTFAQVDGQERSPYDQGFCYLKIVRREFRAKAAAVLGSHPTFQALLSAEACWYDVTNELFVVRDSPGLYHVGEVGMVRVAECLSGVMLAGGFVSRPNTIASLVEGFNVSPTPGLVAKGPKQQDRCGAFTGGGCLPCTVGDAYVSGVGDWGPGGLALPTQDVNRRSEVRFSSGMLLVVYTMGDGLLAVVPFSCEADSRAVGIVGLHECDKHGSPLGVCGCSIANAVVGSMYAHVVSERSLVPVECRGHCGVRSMSAVSKVMLSVRLTSALVKTPPWQVTFPKLLDDCVVHRRLGWFLDSNGRDAFEYTL